MFWLGVAALVAWLVSSEGSSTPGTGAIPAGSAEWRAEAIRTAACALWNNNIRDPDQMAAGIAVSVYPDYFGDDPSRIEERAAQKGPAGLQLWRELLDYATHVVTDPNDQCGVQ